jgi:hypothetical protein
MDAFLIPGGFGTRQEMHNRRLHDYVHSLPQECLLTSVCTGSWVYAQMGLLDGLAATNRKEPDRAEAAGAGQVPIDRLAEIASACRISRARVVDAGRIITAGGMNRPDSRGGSRISRAIQNLIGHGAWIPPIAARRLRGGVRRRVARVMEYASAYKLYRDDLEATANRIDQPA